MFALLKRNPRVTIFVVAYQMQRELPRTLYSIASKYQDWSGVNGNVVVIDNGSSPSVVDYATTELSLTVPISIRRVDVGPSPLSAVNQVVLDAESNWICIVLDGARLWSPGVIQKFRESTRRFKSVPNGPMAWHLGYVHQSIAPTIGYDQLVEDSNLQKINWCHEGYRLFEISSLAGSNPSGFYGSLNEATALFVTRDQWQTIGGFDPRFVSVGGGYGCLDLFERLLKVSNNCFAVHLGEGTFHQIHGGISTSSRPPHKLWQDEYQEIRGKPYVPPQPNLLYVGEVNRYAQKFK